MVSKCLSVERYEKINEKRVNKNDDEEFKMNEIRKRSFNPLDLLSEGENDLLDHPI